MSTLDIHSAPVREYVQWIGERALYEQQVTNDTITTATWTRTPTSGCTILTTTDSETSTRALVEVSTAGVYLLQCELFLASGQELIGLIRIFARAVPTV